MKDPRCVVEVGSHPGPFYRDVNSLNPHWQVCSRHRSQYEERESEFGPYHWIETDGWPIPTVETVPLGERSVADRLRHLDARAVEYRRTHGLAPDAALVVYEPSWIVGGDADAEVGRQFTTEAYAAERLRITWYEATPDQTNAYLMAPGVVLRLAPRASAPEPPR